MVGVRVDDTRITPLLNCVRCGLRSFLMTYICLPLGANPISKLIWNSVISMFEKKSTWKRRYYLLGHESHWLKHLCWTAIYFLPLFEMLAMAAKKLEYIQRNFWWKDVKWDELHIVSDKTKEGSVVGNREVGGYKLALLSKRRWRYRERDVKCRKFFQAWKEVLWWSYRS